MEDSKLVLREYMSLIRTSMEAEMGSRLAEYLSIKDSDLP